MQDSNNKNTILAIVLSLIVVFAWEYFYASPKRDAEQRKREAEQALLDDKSGQQGTADAGAMGKTGGDAANIPAPETNGSAVPSAPGQQAANADLSRDQAIAQATRVKIQTEKLTGSINLSGARIDDLHLNDYHATVDDSSPTIVLLSPSTTKNGFFAEFGYVGKEAGKLPGPNTQWQQEGEGILGVNSPVTLVWQNDKGVTFKRTISIDDQYMFTFNDEISNTGSDPIAISAYGRVTRFGEPNTNGAYVIHEGLIGVVGEHNLEEISYSDAKEDGPVKSEKADKGWVGIADKYWGATVIPGGPFVANFNYFIGSRPHYQSDYLSDPVSIDAGSSQKIEQKLFAGAKVVSVLEKYDEAGVQDFDLLIDWGWFYFLTKPMFWALDWLFHMVGNFGVAMMILTVIIKIFFLPLANMSYASMAKMKKLQPEMMAIKERHGDDRVAQQQAMMELYRKEKINPAAGCWPMLVQIPVFFAIYKVLYVTIEMRHAPFFGWIHDLAAPDPTSLFNLFGLLPFDPPFGIMLGVWPLIMGITMFLQMRLNPAPPDPTQAMIFTWMPVVFTFMLASFPAGLVIYWAWNNTLSIIQQSIIMKRHGVKNELWTNLKGLLKRKKTEEPGE